MVNDTREKRAPKNKCSSKSYIKLKLFSKFVYAVADSGSTISLVSKDILPASSLESLEEYTGKIVAAEGSSLDSLGQLKTQVCIADKELQIDMVVVDNLKETLLIGTDFFVQNGCVLNFGNLSFTIGETTVPLLTVKDSFETVYKTVVQKTVTIPANSFVENVRLKCKNKRRNTYSYSTCSAIFEPNTDLLTRKHKLESEDLLVNVVKGKTLMRVLNCNDYPVTIYRNQTVGKVSTIARDSVNFVKNSQEEEIKTDLVQDIDEEVLFRKLNLSALTHLSPEEMSEVKNLVRRHKKVFALDETHIQPADLPPLKLKLTTDKPIRVPPRPISLALRPEAEKLVKKLMDLDVIEHVTDCTKYHSNAFIISKPNATGNNSKFHLISDYRNINRYLEKTIHSLPDIDTVASLWKDCRYWANLDLSLGYYQCMLSEESRSITNCSIAGVLTFRYKRVPLGLCVSGSHFQGVLERTLLGLKNTSCVQFLDDLALANKTFKGLLESLEAIFKRLEAVKLVLKPEKTRLFQRQIEYLGHTLSEEGLGMRMQKVEAIAKMSRPRNKKQIKSFIAMASYYRRFIHQFSEIVKPLNMILRGNERFSWGPEQQSAFDTIRKKLLENPILKFPDMSKPFVLKVDSSDYCTGAILSQRGDDNFLHPVAFASRLLTPVQSRWSAYQRELYAMKYYICDKFSVYLKDGKPFTVLTDHKPLLQWRSSKQMDGPLWRWYSDLSTYDFEVVHIEGSKNISDCPSRLPMTTDNKFESYLQSLDKQGKIQKTDIAEDLEETDIEKLPEVVKQVVSQSNEATQESTIGIERSLAISETTQKKSPDQEVTDQSPVMAEETIEDKWEIQFLDKETLRKAQADDPVLSIVKRWVEAGIKPALTNKTQKLSPELKNYRSSFDRLKLKDGILFRTWEQGTLENPLDLVCLPEYYQETIIRLAHDIPSSGHFGQFKTLQRVRSRFYFPHCELMVKLHIENCVPCILKAGKRKPISPLQPFYGTHPNDIVQLDLCGPFPNNIHGYKYILVIICKFTGWAEAIPMKETTSAKVARELLDVWIARNGLMNQLHSDRGPQFCSEVFKAVFTMLGLVYQSHTTAYNPKSDGGAEKLVRTVKQLLTAYCSENPEVWPDMLQTLMFAYRTSVSTTTKYSPMFLHTGRVAKIPMDLALGTYTPKRFGTQGEYAYDLYKTLRKVYKFVEDHLKASREIAKQYYDNRCNVKQYEIGDKVYLWRPKKKGSNTFTSNFYGPFEIIKQVGDYNYKIDVGNSKIHNVVPHNLLRLAPQHTNGRRDFEPVDLELDHSLELLQNPEGPPLEDRGFTAKHRNDDNQRVRPIIMLDNHPPVVRRGDRIRRQPVRYPDHEVL